MLCLTYTQTPKCTVCHYKTSFLINFVKIILLVNISIVCIARMLGKIFTWHRGSVRRFPQISVHYPEIWENPADLGISKPPDHLRGMCSNFFPNEGFNLGLKVCSPVRVGAGNYPHRKWRCYLVSVGDSNPFT